jgi:hypothetical protein
VLGIASSDAPERLLFRAQLRAAVKRLGRIARSRNRRPASKFSSRCGANADAPDDAPSTSNDAPPEAISVGEALAAVVPVAVTLNDAVVDVVLPLNGMNAYSAADVVAFRQRLVPVTPVTTWPTVTLSVAGQSTVVFGVGVVAGDVGFVESAQAAAAATVAHSVQRMIRVMRAFENMTVIGRAGVARCV